MTSWGKRLVLVALALCISSLARGELLEQEWIQLIQGGIVWHKDLPPVDPSEAGGFGGTFFLLIKASPESIFQLFTDWSKYPRLFSRVRECELVEKSEGVQVVRFKVDAIFFMLDYFLRHTLDSQHCRISWKLDRTHPNTVKFATGYISIEKAPGMNGRSLVTYAADADISKPFFLPSILKRRYMKKEVFRALGELRTIAETH